MQDSHPRRPGDSRYLRLAERILKLETLRAATELPVIDLEIVVSFLGIPERPTIALVVETDDELASAEVGVERVANVVRRLLADGGYPADAAQSAFVYLASREQIQAAGGWWNFFH